MERKYTLIKGEFPVTNHMQVDDGNLGWTRGVFEDGTPFEAELWDHGKERNICIFVLEDSISDSVIERKTDDNTIEFYKEIECIDSGILSIGMVDNGYETDFDIIQKWVNYMVENDIVRFVGKWENGAVQHVVDINGNSFAGVIIALYDENTVFAETDLEWNNYPLENRKKRFRVIL